MSVDAAWLRVRLRRVERLPWAPPWWGLRGGTRAGLNRDDGLEVATTVHVDGPEAAPRWYVCVAEGHLFDHDPELMGEDTVWLDAKTAAGAIAEVDRRWPWPGGLRPATWASSEPEA